MKNFLSKNWLQVAGAVGVGAIMAFSSPLAAFAEQIINEDLTVNGQIYSSGQVYAEGQVYGGGQGRFDGGLVGQNGRININENGTGEIHIGSDNHDDGIWIGNTADAVAIVGSNWSISDAGAATFASVSYTSLGLNGASPLFFEGATVDGTNKTTFAVTDPTAARTITIPDASGNMVVAVGGVLTSDAYATSSNCSSTASPATCGSAAAGSVAIATGQTTLTVNDSAVTANSLIFLTEDFSLGAKLGITCNSTPGRTYAVSQRTAGTSFGIKSSSAPTVLKACLSYHIVN